MFIAPALLLSSGTTVATYRWDLSATAGVQDGQGTWNTTNTYFTKDNGATRVAWVPGSIAQFGGGVSGTAAGNIVTGTQTCTGLIFNTPFAGAYTFGGGTIAFIGASFIECNSATGMTGSGVLSGGTITVRGSAVFTIAGSSTANTIDTLNVTSVATVTFNSTYGPKLPTNLVVDGTVNLSASTTVTVSSLISGTGTINITTTPAVTLSANNTFSGSINLTTTGAVVNVGSGTAGSLGTGTVSLSSAYLQFDRTDTYTVTNNVTGTMYTSNTSRMRNGGTMIYTGTWSATGAVRFTLTSSCTLQIGNGGTVGDLPLDIVGATGTTLIFNRSNAYSHVGMATAGGTGALTHAGTGTLTLTSNQTYTGATTVSAGPLRLGGNLAATAVTVANVAGASIGASTAATRTIAGSVTFAGSNAALDVQTNGSTVASRLTVTGSVVRGGAKVNVLGALNAGTYIIISGASGSSSGSEFTIGTNLSGRTCTFSTVSGVTTMTAS